MTILYKVDNLAIFSAMVATKHKFDNLNNGAYSHKEYSFEAIKHIFEEINSSEYGDWQFDYDDLREYWLEQTFDEIKSKYSDWEDLAQCETTEELALALAEHTFSKYCPVSNTVLYIHI